MTNFEESKKLLLDEANRMQGYADMEQRRFSETGSESSRVKMYEFRAKRDGLMFAVEVLDAIPKTR